MHPLDSSLDTSVHHHLRGGLNSNNYTKARRPRRTSLDNGATTEELILLVTSSNKSIASIARTNSIDTLDNSSDNIMLSTGQWYNYNSDDDMEESDYFAASGYVKPHANRRSGQRRLSLNNCTAMNMTFLANYNVSTADKSDLDVDCHNYFDENKATTTLTTATGNSSSCDTMSVGTKSSYQSGLDSVAGGSSVGKPSMVVSDDDNYANYNYNDDDDDDDDDDMDSFGEAEDAEPADEEYIRKNLGASCIWNDEIPTGGEQLPPPPPVRRGGKKTASKTSTNSNNNDHCHYHSNEDMVLSNTSNNSNPIPNDSAGTTSSEEFTVMNTHPVHAVVTTTTTASHHHQDVAVIYTTNHGPFYQDDDDDDDGFSGDDVMDVYHDETLDVVVAIPQQVGNDNHNENEYEYNERGDDDDDDYGDDYDAEDSDCDSFCDANDDEKADKEYMKRVLGASCYWSNSMDDLGFNVTQPADTSTTTGNISGDSTPPPPQQGVKRSISRKKSVRK